MISVSENNEPFLAVLIRFRRRPMQHKFSMYIVHLITGNGKVYEIRCLFFFYHEMSLVPFFIPLKPP